MKAIGLIIFLLIIIAGFLSGLVIEWKESKNKPTKKDWE